MQLKSSSTLSKNSSGFDWSTLESEVPELDDLASVLDQTRQSGTVRSQAVRWQDLPTTTLVTLAQAGRMDAFDPLYRRFAARLLKHALCRLNGNEAKAQDAVSETWLSAVSSIGTWGEQGRSEEDFVRWLYGILRRKLGAIRLDRWREAPTEDPGRDDRQYAGLLLHSDQVSDTEADSPTKRELLPQLHEAIQSLSPRQNLVVRLRLEGLPAGEVAQRAGLSSTEAWRAWDTARRTLRFRLSRSAVSIDDLMRTDPDLLRTLAQTLSGIHRDITLMRLDGVDWAEIRRRTGRTAHQIHELWRWAKDRLRHQLLDPNRDQPQQRLHDRMRAAIPALPPNYQQVVLLRLEGLSFRQVGKRVGLTEAGARSTWRRAVDRAETTAVPIVV